MAVPVSKYKLQLAEHAVQIDLSPRQWYLLAEDIGLGHIFEGEGSYDLSWRSDEQREYLKDRAANRLVRNGLGFVQIANAIESELSRTESEFRFGKIQRMPDDVSNEFRKAQVAISWLRARSTNIANEFCLLAPFMGLVLPGETYVADAKDASGIPEAFDLESSDEGEANERQTVRLIEILETLNVTVDEWEFLASRFGPAATLETDEIAKVYGFSRDQMFVVLAAVQDRLAEDLILMRAPLESLNRHIERTWLMSDLVSVRDSGTRMMNALDLDGIDAEREEVDKFLNGLRAIDKLDQQLLGAYPRVRERLWLVR